MNMVKKIAFSIVGVSMLLLLSGCGSSSSSSSSSLTGYYVDSAVKGVEYSCGDRSGTTDADGKFHFKKGDECKFTLAGLELRKFSTKELADGAKIVETTPEVAAFLQSIDKDGNAGNGIDIDSKMVDVLGSLVKDYNVTLIPTGEKLAVVVERLTQKVDGFEGSVVSEEDALKHLKETKESVIREFVASKVFWMVGKSSSEVYTGSIKFNDDGTGFIPSYEDNPDNNEYIDLILDGDKVMYGNGTYSVVVIKDGYFELINYNSDGTPSTFTTVPERFYFRQKDAQAYYSMLDSSLTLTDRLSSKTYWMVGKDEDGLFDGALTFNEDVTEFTTVEDGQTITVPITIDEDKLIFEDGHYSQISVKDGYLESVSYKADGTLDTYNIIPTRLYLNEDDAIEYYYSLSPTLQDLVAGETYWIVGKDQDGVFNDALTFNEDLTAFTTVEDGQTVTEQITVDGNRVTFSDGSYVIVTIKVGYIESVAYNADGTLDDYELIPARLFADEIDAKVYYYSL